MWFVAIAAAQVHTIRVPFPTTRLFEVPDTVCLKVGDVDFEVAEVEVEDGSFSARCSSAKGQTEACVTLLADRWPGRIAPLQCQGMRGTIDMVPVQAFDPSDDPEDGVQIVRKVDVIQGAFRTRLPDAVGVMAGGSCGVKDGRFWVVAAEEPRNQQCLLVLPDTTERTIPVTLVNKLTTR